MRHFIPTSLVGLAALLLAGSANATVRHHVSPPPAGLAVPTDQVRMIVFPQPVATVYVGNPSIADVTIIDASHAFVLGKNYGTTNMVALDNKGNQVYSKVLTIYGSSGGTVTVQRGTVKLTYACVRSRCEPAPMPGDDKEPFDSVTGQMEKRTAEAKSAVSPENQ